MGSWPRTATIKVGLRGADQAGIGRGSSDASASTKSHASVRAQAVQAVRMGSAGFLLLLGGAFTAIAALKSHGFVVAVLLRWALGPLVVGSALTVWARRQTLAIRRSAGLRPGDRLSAVLRPQELQVVPDGLASLLAVGGLLGFGTVTVFFLPVAVAAASLQHPTTATVLSARVTGGDCGRCHHGAMASFQVNGRTVVARLAASSMGAEPTSVVYDAEHPAHAMAADDYSFGNSQAPWRRLAGGLLLGGGSMGWGMLRARRSRSRLSSARPTMAIVNIELRTPNRGPDRWRVQFVDGKHAEYYDAPHQRALLAGRIACDPAGYTPTPVTATQLLSSTLPGNSTPAS